MRFLILTKIFYFCCFVQFSAFANETRMAYSDLIPNEFQEYFSESPVSLEKNLNAEVNSLVMIKSGSLPMIEDFLSNRLDICILAIPEEDDLSVLEDESIVKIPFAYKSSVVVVNAENPISEITKDQLYTIFGSTSTSSNLRTWRDFGLSSFSTSSIKAYVVKEDNGISSDLFRYTALNEMPFNTNVNIEEAETVERMIIQDKAAIGIFPKNPENANLKVLFMADDEESIAYGPSIDNIYYLDYPIRLPFYIVYKIRDTKRLYPLINNILSDSVSEILEAHDFFPLPKVIREKLIIDTQLYLQENED